MEGGAPPPLCWVLWALALVTYEMLTGVHPFVDVHPVGWRAALRAERWRPIGELLADASPALQEFFSRALGAIPVDRPPSAPAFLQRFEAAAA